TIANGAVGVATTGQRLTWYGGFWPQTYDVYFGTAPNPPLFASNLALGPSETTSQTQSFNLPALTAGTTYYWKIVSSAAAAATSGRGDDDCPVGLEHAGREHPRQLGAARRRRRRRRFGAAQPEQRA